MTACGQSGQRRCQIEQARFARRLQRHRFDIVVRRDLADDGLRQLGERRTGADFEEGPHAVAQHRPDQADELHRLRQLIAEQIPAESGVVRIFRGRAVRVDRRTGSEIDRVEFREEWSGRVRDQLAVEGGGHRELHGPDVLRSENRRDPFDVGGAPGQHRLLRAVLVGQHHARNQLRFDFAQRGDHREHRPGIAVPLGGHQFPASLRQPEEVGGANSPGGRERRKFPVAVAGERIGTQSEAFAEDAVRPIAHGPEGGLGDVGCLQRFVLAGLRVRGERRRRIEEVAQPRPVLHRVGTGQRLEHFGEGAGEFAEHADALRSLAGEEDRQLAGRRAAAEEGPFGRLPLPRGILVRQPSSRPCQQLIQVGVGAVRHEDQPQCRRCIEVVPRRFRRTGKCNPGRRFTQWGQHREQFVDRPPRHREDFDLAVPIRLGFRRPVLFEHGVEVGTAEAERRQSRPARVLGPRQPGSHLRVHIKRAIRCVQRIDRVDHFDRRRQHFVEQRHRHFD